MSRNFFFPTIILLFVFCLDLRAQKSVTYDGYVALDARHVYNNDFPELFTKAKVEFEFKIMPMLEVEVDVRGNTKSSTIRLHEVHATLALTPTTEFKIGNLKKPLGSEEITSKEDLSTIEESQINMFIAPFGYIGRDPGIQLEVEREDSRSFTYGISYNQSGNLGFCGRVSTGKKSTLLIGIDGVYQLCTIRNTVLSEYYPLHSFVVSLDGGRRWGIWMNEVEGFFGLDPIATQLNEISGYNERVHFIAAKWLSALSFELGHDLFKTLEPVLMCNIICPDLGACAIHRLEVLGGFNIFFDKNISIRTNAGLILLNNEDNTKDYTLGAGSKVLFEAMVKW